MPGVWEGGSPPTLGPIWAQVGALATKKQKKILRTTKYMFLNFGSRK